MTIFTISACLILFEDRFSKLDGNYVEQSICVDCGNFEDGMENGKCMTVDKGEKTILL